MDINDSQDIMLKFIQACEDGRSSEIKHLLILVSKPTFPRKKLEAQYRSPIYWACKGGNLEVVKILLDQYPDCSPYHITDKGHNLLYVACARGHISVTSYLSEVHSISPTQPNGDGVTPLFAATFNGHYEMLKFLISNLKCDPKSFDKDGNSIFHVACERNHLDIAQYLVKKHNISPMVKNNFKKTPLHSACSSGNLSIVKYLIDELDCEAEVFDNMGCSPLHDASRNGHSNIVQYFIEKKFDLSLYDNSGCTPLHLGCRFGRKNVVKMLLTRGKVDPNFRTLTDLSPIEISRDEATRELVRGGATTLGKSLKIFEEYKVRHPLPSIVHIFVVGHSESGKSTLVNSLQCPYSCKRKSCPEAVPHTAGIIPKEFESPEFGKILLYDFAGHYEFHPSHAAFLEHSNFSSPPLFLLVVNVNEKFDDSKRKVNYWIQFVENHSIPGTSLPHVIVIGSHFDLLSKVNASVVNQVEEYTKARLHLSLLAFDGFFSIDCRAPNKQGEFRMCLKQICSKLHTSKAIDPACHVLREVLLQKFKKSFGCTIQDVIKVASKSNYPLPLQADCLCKLSELLSARTKILFLKNEMDLQNSWIVLDIDALLHNISGKLFAPQGFHTRSLEATHTGILPLSQLKKHFPNFNTSLIIEFLGRLEFCQVISDSEVLDHLINESHSCTCENILSVTSEQAALSSSGELIHYKDCPIGEEHTIPFGRSKSEGCICYFPSHNPSMSRLDLQEKYLFFPGLIYSEQPKDDMWREDNVFEFYTGWSLQCINDHQFFSLRFLQTLILRLSLNFAISKFTSGTKCILWKNGLNLLRLDGIEIIIEVVEDRKAVLLLLRVKQCSIMEGLHLRSAIIKKILDTKEDYCSQIGTSESLLDPSYLKARHGYPVINRPIAELRKYDIALIATAFSHKYPYVYDVKGHLIGMEEIIKFDPYMSIGKEVLNKLYQKDRQDCALTQELLLEFSHWYPEKGDIFADILFGQTRHHFPTVVGDGQEPFNPCFRVLCRYWESEKVTLADFRKKLDVYSIFCGRNILEISK